MAPQIFSIATYLWQHGKRNRSYVEIFFETKDNRRFTILLFSLTDWAIGCDGSLGFENIGDGYTEAHVPYDGMCDDNAILGSVTVRIAYAIMKECGYSSVVLRFPCPLQYVSYRCVSYIASSHCRV